MKQLGTECSKGPILGAALGLEAVSEPLMLQVSGMDHAYVPENNNELKVFCLNCG